MSMKNCIGVVDGWAGHYVIKLGVHLARRGHSSLCFCHE